MTQTANRKWYDAPAGWGRHTGEIEPDRDPNGSFRILGTGDRVTVDGRKAKITKISQNGMIYVMFVTTGTTIKVPSWQIEKD